jgi:hypothetical protein
MNALLICCCGSQRKGINLILFESFGSLHFVNFNSTRLECKQSGIMKTLFMCDKIFASVTHSESSFQDKTVTVYREKKYEKLQKTKHVEPSKPDV